MNVENTLKKRLVLKNKKPENIVYKAEGEAKEKQANPRPKQNGFYSG
ncbi:MAG: hypothetical protein J6N81_10535 [Treponema sp.]|nr:hypothetical protein [Treponema sp.]